ncbi:type IV pilus assembly protein PilC [Chitinivorax tropicus]|uniref:General secretion pathway protein F n=1 Tax=Chitinivorax tropicus TaxID=714531 RepID=A0A840MSU7_9PROT|nr:type II secretion system F family protein [Chitinivorax tropicus]MBB5019476.1 type IV pilus assembly protein PilC [Chitinivorax tropicus]
MPRYRYASMNEAGQRVTGFLDAANAGDLEQRLARMGLDLITFDQDTVNSLRRRGVRIDRQELITFCFHLEQLTRAGVPIMEGLADLRDSVENPRFREVVADLIDSIEGGKQLSDAMSAHPRIFDVVFCNLIRAGETTGRLPEVLQDLSDGLKWQDELAAQMKKIILYPSFVLVLVLAVFAFLLIFLVPQLVELFQSLQVEVPMQTRMLVALSGFMRQYWFVLVLAPVAGWLVVVMRLRAQPAFRHTLDRYKLSLPFVGPILRKIILARFSNYFALMFSAGIPVLDALKVLEGIVGNRVIAEGVAQVEQLIREGTGIAASFSQVGLFPPLVLRMLRVGESTGQLDTALLNVCYFYNRDVKESVERVQVMIEPVMTVILGLMLAWIMSSVLGPVFDLISKVGTR